MSFSGPSFVFPFLWFLICLSLHSSLPSRLDSFIACPHLLSLVSFQSRPSLLPFVLPSVLTCSFFSFLSVFLSLLPPSFLISRLWFCLLSSPLHFSHSCRIFSSLHSFPFPSLSSFVLPSLLTFSLPSFLAIFSPFLPFLVFHIFVLYFLNPYFVFSCYVSPFLSISSSYCCLHSLVFSFCRLYFSVFVSFLLSIINLIYSFLLNTFFTLLCFSNSPF